MKGKQCFVVLLVPTLILLILVGCSENSYVFRESVDEIETIEIVSAESCTEFTVLKTLSETEKNDFLTEFHQLMEKFLPSDYSDSD